MAPDCRDSWKYVFQGLAFYYWNFDSCFPSRLYDPLEMSIVAMQHMIHNGIFRCTCSYWFTTLTLIELPLATLPGILPWGFQFPSLFLIHPDCTFLHAHGAFSPQSALSCFVSVSTSFFFSFFFWRMWTPEMARTPEKARSHRSLCISRRFLTSPSRGTSPSQLFSFFFSPTFSQQKRWKKNLHWGNTLKLSEYVSPEPVRFFERAR